MGVLIIILFTALIFGAAGYTVGRMSLPKIVVKHEHEPLDLYADLMVEAKEQWDLGDNLRAMHLEEMAKDILQLAKQERDAEGEPKEIGPPY